MKKIILLSLACAGIFIILAGCMMPASSRTIYILDNNQPPRPIMVPAETIQLPPGTVVEAQPALVVVDTVPEVYYVQSTPNMFFYSSLWYYYYGGFWYRSNSHRGPWISLEVSYVPERFHRIPERHFQHAQPPRSEPDHRGGQGDHQGQGGHQDGGNHGRGGGDHR